MKQSKSMNNKIRTPFLVLIVIYALVTLVLFNVAIRVYLEKNARSELLAVVKTMETTVDKEFTGNWRNFTDKSLDSSFIKLYKALNSSKLSVNTEMLLFNRREELLYPKDETDSFVNEGLVEQISTRLNSMQDKKIYTLRVGTKRYLILSYPLTDTARESPKIVFVAHMTSAIYMIRAINLILICIMLVGAAIAALIASRLSRNIAHPVIELCEMTKEIGSGKFQLPKQSNVTNDILELNMLFQSISEMSLRLEAYDKSQKTFLQNASHELKTPLMSIQGYAEGIEQGVITDVKKAANIICSESMRLSALVDELLTLSRIESQTYAKELITVNLCDILKEYAQRIGGFAAKSQRQLNLSLPKYPLYIMADDTLLSQAVMNIASNCLRYSKTAADIELLHVQSNAIIRIMDDGDGIPETDISHIFERFYKGKGGNFGLGLAIAKSAVEFMGGSVSAYNKSTGAVFEIKLPLVQISM
ncbi:MAG: HAMP domain-containing sensor histidine kinase [Sedimentibacter sp.]